MRLLFPWVRPGSLSPIQPSLVPFEDYQVRGDLISKIQLLRQCLLVLRESAEFQEGDGELNCHGVKSYHELWSLLIRRVMTLSSSSS